MPLLAFERRQAQAILEAYAPPRAVDASSDAERAGEPAGDELKESGERPVRLLAPRVGEVDYLRSVHRMMEASTGMARLGIHLGLFIAMWSPLWMLGRLRTMKSLPIDERSDIIGKLLRHRVFFVRELMLLLKIGASMALLGTPSVRARSNYDRKRAPEGQPREGVRKLPVLVADRIPEVA